ncbi:hypothetical protein [Moheibacter sediminis]|nr:hypothetical protein [Moheibacter sediminis]
MISEEEKLNLIKKIEEQIGLQFLNESISGNLCLINNNQELRNEFKQSFTEMDFRNFLKSFQNKNVEFPGDALTFWKLVEKGK